MVCLLFTPSYPLTPASGSKEKCCSRSLPMPCVAEDLGGGGREVFESEGEFEGEFDGEGQGEGQVRVVAQGIKDIQDTENDDG